MIDDAAQILTPQDPGYPPALRTIADPPEALYVRGSLREVDRQAVAVVGARRASSYGLSVAEWLGRELVHCGITVVSGMARGIDGAAHRGALAAGGRTIAVLGCGPDVVYPPEHAELMVQVIDAGAIMTEFPPGTAPLPQHFPQRNRIISGLSLGVVVVEGRVQSGALVTADFALQQGREVFAVPGHIFAETAHLPHRLIQEGAKLVTTVDDILSELRLPHRPPPPQEPELVLDGVEAAIYAELSLDPQHIDAISLRCGLPVAEVGGALLALELKGAVRSLAGQRYIVAHPMGAAAR
ncbi:MAG: DNA-processing protein DprA [bacterium]